MTAHPHELISAYADRELEPEQARRVEAHLALCTECARELALIRSIGTALNGPVNPTPASIWPAVHRRISRPVGWLLLVGGVVTWLALAVVEWLRARTLTLEWLGTTAVVIGLALLVVGVAYDQYTEWKTSPYRHIHQ